MKDYFSHDYFSRNDTKLVKASMKFGLHAIGAYWCIVEMLYEEGGYLPLSEYERITFELRTSNELITYLLHESELFKNDGEKFWSESAIDRLKMRAEKSQKARESIENRWKRKTDTNVLQTNNERNTSKVKESKENINESIDIIKDESIISEFHRICISLPKVKSISDSRKRKLSARKKDIPDIETWINLFKLAEASDFLTGRSSDWKANFDWIIENDKNYLKILEGNYDNRKTNKTSTQLSTGDPNKYDNAFQRR